MKATEVLMKEHRVIERVLSILEKAAGRLKNGEAVKPAFFIDAAEFIKGFADGCHHKKVEGVLGGGMVIKGIGTYSGDACRT